MTPSAAAGRRSPQQVVPGLWSIRVEVPLPGLSMVIVYALEVPGGIVLVDAGWSSRASLTSLERGLGALSASIADVRGAVFTHAHGDHYGLAGPLRERTGCWIALHEADVVLAAARIDGADRARDELALWLAEAGVDDLAEVAAIEAGGARFAWEFPAVLPDIRMVDGMRLQVQGWELDVLHTPGHTPGHVVLVDLRERVVLTGDAVLPRITPNISASPYALDPLTRYLGALEAVERLGDVRGLPGHGPQLPSVARRAREIAEHHEEQLRETLALVGAGAETVRDVAERMPWSRPWGSLPSWDRRAALGEAQAHLVALQGRGDVERISSSPLRWRRSRTESR